MCVRALGKGGNAIEIGEYNCFNKTIKIPLVSFRSLCCIPLGLRGNMYVVLSDQAPDMDLPSGTSTQGNETLLTRWKICRHLRRRILPQRRRRGLNQVNLSLSIQVLRRGMALW